VANGCHGRKGQVTCQERKQQNVSLIRPGSRKGYLTILSNYQ